MDGHYFLNCTYDVCRRTMAGEGDHHSHFHILFLSVLDVCWTLASLIPPLLPLSLCIECITYAASLLTSLHIYLPIHTQFMMGPALLGAVEYLLNLPFFAKMRGPPDTRQCLINYYRQVSRPVSQSVSQAVSQSLVNRSISQKPVNEWISGSGPSLVRNSIDLSAKQSVNQVHH